MKIATIIGARPQFIKAATISRAIHDYNTKVSISESSIKKYSQITEIIIHTGQHYDANMSDIFFREMAIPIPDYNLRIQECRHGAMTGNMLAGIEEILLKEKSDWVLVYGDTNSTLSGALAAAKLHIPVAHVEAGLRSYNRSMPEEINRIMADQLSTFLFCPNENAVQNLYKEGFPHQLSKNNKQQIFNCGDVMYDASLYYAQMAKRPEFVEKLPVDEGYILATIHRAENTDDPLRLKKVMQDLSKLSIPVILPLHPRTKVKLEQSAIRLGSNIFSVEPVGFLQMVWLERHAQVIVTDSGGVQKEAYFYGVPCVTVRDETEWVELIDAGWNWLAPPLSSDLAQVVTEVIGSKGNDSQLYGNGDAAKNILENLTIQ